MACMKKLSSKFSAYHAMQTTDSRAGGCDRSIAMREKHRGWGVANCPSHPMREDYIECARKRPRGSEASLINTRSLLIYQDCELAGLGTLLNWASTWMTPFRCASRGP